MSPPHDIAFTAEELKFIRDVFALRDMGIAKYYEKVIANNLNTILAKKMQNSRRVFRKQPGFRVWAEEQLPGDTHHAFVVGEEKIPFKQEYHSTDELLKDAFEPNS